LPFIQVIDFSTTRFADVEKLLDQYRNDLGDRTKIRRATICRDRDREYHYVSIVEFDSYEDAMENSALPETTALAQMLMGLTAGPPSYLNLDMVRTDYADIAGWLPDN
jgi:hypothetical protein